MRHKYSSEESVCVYVCVQDAHYYETLGKS